jgi:uncharacterized protein YcnI
MSHPRRGLRAAAAAVGVALVALAVPASAHVTVNPDTATQGGFTKLSFRVPTESDTASTTKLQVVFPVDQPLGFVSVKPHAGWSYKVVKSKLATPITTDDGQVTEAVSQITWTADSPATAIKPGEFDEFDVSVGPLPEADSMTFKALQTYSDGSVVRWIEPTAAGGAEPEHPAPVLTLQPADQGASTNTPAPADTATSDSGDGKTNVALIVSILALLAAGGSGTASLLGRRKA